jgi:uncharacterized glyoxalase superfamily protein PhnB
MTSAIEKAAAMGVHSLSPHLVCKGAADAIEFYKKAFDATEMMRLAGEDGRIMHGCVSINGSSVMLVEEAPDWELSGPKALGGTPVTLHLVVEDADAVAQRAVDAGATLVMPAADMFWGDRYGIVEDPFGHRWSVATPVREMSAEEIQVAAKGAMCGEATAPA